MEEKPLKIAIIGAGIGGLSLAIALKLKGNAVTVFEKTRTIGVGGAGIQLSSNGVKVLRLLGLEREVELRATIPESILLRDAISDRQVGLIPLGRIAEKRYGAHFFQVHRADLIEILFKKAQELNVEVRMESEGRAKRLKDQLSIISNRDEKFFDLIIGADGIHSQTRKEFFQAESPKFLGQVVYRSTVPMLDLPSSFSKRAVQVFLGAGSHVVSYPLVYRGLVNFVFCRSEKTWEEKSWWCKSDNSELSEYFSSFNSINPIFKKVKSVTKWGMLGYESSNKWASGSMVLIGDASHPMLPFLAQGGNQALEDALALATFLSRFSSYELSEKIEKFVQNRINRVSKVQKASRRNAWAYHISNPALRSAAHLGLSFLSGSMPNYLLSRFDWLYGYELDKEF